MNDAAAVPLMPPGPAVSVPGQFWWFYSEFTYDRHYDPGSLQLGGASGANTALRNTVQWLPFSAVDVAVLERALARAHCSGDSLLAAFTDDRVDELALPGRFVAVRKEAQRYLKVDLGRMRMAPIYWQADEHLVRRSQWFMVPETGKLVEGVPVPPSLETLLNHHYSHALDWVSVAEPAPSDVIEKIVDLDEFVVPAHEGPLKPSELLLPPRAFLVFRRGCSDYVRLGVKKGTAGGGAGKRQSLSLSRSVTPPQLPLQPPDTAATMNLPSTAPPHSTVESFKFFRSYAAFYHALAGVNGYESVGTAVSQSATGSNAAAHNAHGPSSAYPGAGPDASAQMTVNLIRIQNHSFKSHPLPSPEWPEPGPETASVTSGHVVLLVHGVGQRIFRKMGMHFNKDCDDFRSMLMDMAASRNLPAESVVVLPVGWRAELDLAGNFTFGDDERGTLTEAEEAELNATLKVDDRPVSPASSSAIIPNAANVLLDLKFTEILERLALDSIPAVRSVLLDATMDVMLYVSAKHFDRIMAAILKELRRLHRLHAHWHPNFTGTWTLIGHSLGSALVADLLTVTVQPDQLIRQKAPGSKWCDLVNGVAEANEAPSLKLPFQVDRFFAIGSPLGVFHVLKHSKPLGCLRNVAACESVISERVQRWKAARRRYSSIDEATLPSWTVYNCRSFYNLFHPHDPVAHRFEPLISLPSVGGALEPPLKIPYLKSGLTRFKLDLEAKLQRAKEDWARSFKSIGSKLPSWMRNSKHGHHVPDAAAPGSPASMSSGSIAVAAQLDPLVAFNAHFSRVDFCLQDSFIENPYLSAIGAHFCYWSDQDIAAFIINELIKG